MEYKINKQRCTGCQLCVRKCPGSTRIGADGKAEIISQEKLEQCGGEGICQFGAIEATGKKQEREKFKTEEKTDVSRESGIGKGQGFGQGRGFGRGRGRGLGIGPRDGRGRGMGGGGRRRW